MKSGFSFTQCGRIALPWVSTVGGFTPLLHMATGPRRCRITSLALAKCYLKSLLGAGIGEGDELH